MKLPSGPKIPTWLVNLKFAADPLGYMDSVSKRYGDIFTIMFGSTPVVFVSNPQGIKQIFTQTKEITAPGELNEDVAPLVGNNGLLLLDGLRHKNRRQILMPPMHGTRIKTYGKLICDLTETLMSQQTVGKPFLAYPTMQVITLDVILQVLLGLREGDRYEKLRKLLPRLMSFARSSLLETCLSFPSLQLDLGRWSPWGYFSDLMRQFDELVLAEISDRRKQANSSGTDVLSEFISACDETGKPLTDRELRDLFPSLIFGGRDASATAITWALYSIHKHPAVLARLLEELDGLGEKPDPMSIVALPYLTAVCNECMRIYPTQVITFSRMVESPIEVMGYELNPGIILRGCVYLTHQREDLYPEPKQFKPERFLEKQFSNYEFLPFGGGTRRCPGEALALFEMKLILATILSNYKLGLVDKRSERPKPQGVNFPPASGLKMVMLGQRQRQEQYSSTTLARS
ncbi:cytochrome P450 [Microcoleus sp. N3A4]|uniref:cytochrome P450 n=1 Tax=Microcoleus sp. N3A4 TaxID=3055379 RepID=UPI002FD73630